MGKLTAWYVELALTAAIAVWFFDSILLGLALWTAGLIVIGREARRMTGSSAQPVRRPQPARHWFAREILATGKDLLTFGVALFVGGWSLTRFRDDDTAARVGAAVGLILVCVPVYGLAKMGWVVFRHYHPARSNKGSSSDLGAPEGH